MAIKLKKKGAERRERVGQTNSGIWNLAQNLEKWKCTAAVLRERE